MMGKRSTENSGSAMHLHEELQIQSSSNEVESSTGDLSLPTELFEHILSYLDGKSGAYLALASKQIYIKVKNYIGEQKLFELIDRSLNEDRQNQLQETDMEIDTYVKLHSPMIKRSTVVRLMTAVALPIPSILLLIIGIQKLINASKAQELQEIAKENFNKQCKFSYLPQKLRCTSWGDTCNYYQNLCDLTLCYDFTQYCSVIDDNYQEGGLLVGFGALLLVILLCFYGCNFEKFAKLNTHKQKLLSSSFNDTVISSFQEKVSDLEANSEENKRIQKILTLIKKLNLSPDATILEAKEKLNSIQDRLSNVYANVSENEKILSNTSCSFFHTQFQKNKMESSVIDRNEQLLDDFFNEESEDIRPLVSI